MACDNFVKLSVVTIVPNGRDEPDQWAETYTLLASKNDNYEKLAKAIHTALGNPEGNYQLFVMLKGKLGDHRIVDDTTMYYLKTLDMESMYEGRERPQSLSLSRSTDSYNSMNSNAFDEKFEGDERQGGGGKGHTTTWSHKELVLGWQNLASAYQLAAQEAQETAWNAQDFFLNVKARSLCGFYESYLYYVTYDS